ncbi:MAG: Holliday junction resolvase-like protein [Mucilaginibacter sp.]
MDPNVIILIAVTIIIILAIRLYVLNSKIPLLAEELFSKFREKEIETLRMALDDASKRKALADLELWKIEHENIIRQDAINRSQSIILGKVSEHAIPFHTQFPFNPKDLRFVGSPIDMIVFDGADEDREVSIHFLEIKTGNSSLNRKQKVIKDAILSGRVFWRELRV